MGWWALSWASKLWDLGRKWCIFLKILGEFLLKVVNW